MFLLGILSHWEHKEYHAPCSFGTVTERAIQSPREHLKTGARPLSGDSD